MSKRIKSQIITIIIGMALFPVIMYFCGQLFTPGSVDYNIYTSDTITIKEFHYDTTIIVKNDYAPEVVTVVEVLEIPAEIDTLAIIQEYYSINFYSDTLINDSLAYIVINDSVGHNKIKSRSFEYKNRRPTEIITTQIINTAAPRFNFGAGAFVGGNQHSFEIGALASFHIDKNVFTGSYDLNNKTFRVGYVRTFK